jgi:hypothetical protein
METSWIQVVTIVGVNLLMILSAVGITITLWIHSNKRIDTILESVNKEMKDFHGRLCKIEENRNKILRGE